MESSQIPSTFLGTLQLPYQYLLLDWKLALLTVKKEKFHRRWRRKLSKLTRVLIKTCLAKEGEVWKYLRAWNLSHLAQQELLSGLTCLMLHFKFNRTWQRSFKLSKHKSFFWLFFLSMTVAATWYSKNTLFEKFSLLLLLRLQFSWHSGGFQEYKSKLFFQKYFML